jgi:hypothetical protein
VTGKGRQSDRSGNSWPAQFAQYREARHHRRRVIRSAGKDGLHGRRNVDGGFYRLPIDFQGEPEDGKVSARDFSSARGQRERRHQNAEPPPGQTQTLSRGRNSGRCVPTRPAVAVCTTTPLPPLRTSSGRLIADELVRRRRGVNSVARAAIRRLPEARVQIAALRARSAWLLAGSAATNPAHFPARCASHDFVTRNARPQL